MSATYCPLSSWWRALVFHDHAPTPVDKVAEDPLAAEVETEVGLRCCQAAGLEKHPQLGLGEGPRSTIESVEEVERLVGAVAPLLTEGEGLQLLALHVSVVEEPVASLDRVDDAGAPTVGDEGAGGGDVHTVVRRQPFRAVQEDAFGHQV